MASLKSYSDNELSALIKAKKADAKNNVTGGAHTLEVLVKEQERRKKSKNGGSTSITKASPKIEELLSAIRAATEANKCKNVDVLSYCATYLKTGHRLVKVEKVETKK